MAKRNNSAQRMLVILNAAVAQPDGDTISDVWAKSFNLGIEKTTKRDLEVVESLGILYGQFEITKSLIAQTDYSEELYRKSFNRIDGVLSIQNLSSQWTGLKHNLAPETLLAINWLSEVLPDEENSVDSDFVKGIEEQLLQLKKSLEVDNVPLSLKIFVERQIEIIEKAFRQHGVMGTKALRDALYQGYSNSHENDSIVTEYEQSNELSILGKVWNQIKNIPGVVIKTNKALEAGAGVVGKGQKAIEFLENFQM